MNILVTGGAGYIGSHVCKALSTAGYIPITFDNFSRGHKWAIKWGPLVEGDLLNSELIDKVLKQYQPIAIIHLAGLAYVQESIHHPEKYYSSNLIGTYNLAASAIKNKVNNFVFSSSCATYGQSINERIDEQHVQNPINPYGRSKLFAENILRDLSETSNLNIVILRYFNACGADSKGEIGELHTPETHVIPRILMAAHGLIPYFELMGNNLDTRDGSAIRDFIHVDDLASGHLDALKFLLKKNISGCYEINLGTGEGITILEIIAAVERITRKKIPLIISEHRDGDPEKLVADVRLAKELINFDPKNSSLANIISTANQWLLNCNKS